MWLVSLDFLKFHFFDKNDGFFGMVQVSKSQNIKTLKYKILLVNSYVLITFIRIKSCI